MNTNTFSTKDINFVVGIDLGDSRSAMCLLDDSGQILEESQVETSSEGFLHFFDRFPKGATVTIAMETGTHSPWVSDLLLGQGFDVLVGNARKLRMIWQNPNKNDVRDAMMLARIARFDRQLLSPIQHRGRSSQMDLAIIKCRSAVVSTRVNLINTVRGMVKASGARLPSCSTEAFCKIAGPEVPPDLTPALSNVLETIAFLTKQVRQYDHQIDRLCKEGYPETTVLQQVAGVGPVTSLAIILTLESPGRFAKSRDVGPFLGLVPKRDQSGQTDKPLSITKAGDEYLRQLLVGAANYIMGPFGPDCDLRRVGERIASRGGKVARRKAKVAVARKLGVLLHHLWKTGEVYHPLMKEATKTKTAA